LLFGPVGQARRIRFSRRQRTQQLATIFMFRRDRIPVMLNLLSSIIAL
jgi:hypothetical protein